jgi:hypothetical protein
VPDVAPYFVLLDTNVWVAERLLQSSIGNAFLYGLTRDKSSILLPEVVELEIARVLPDLAKRAVGRIRDELSLLRQLSGQDELSITAPSALAIKEGIEYRWKQLAGSLTRTSFTHDQAKSALQRVLNKMPPSGQNNEQFRDCCIWDAAVSMATDRRVHLVSADAAFYEGRSTAAGLAKSLRDELMTTKKHLQIHSSLKDFLAVVEPAVEIDEIAIGDAITRSISDPARQIAEDSWPVGTFELREIQISGYATPKASLVAISFEASFDLERITIENETEAHVLATMTLKGVCSYNPTTKELSDIEIREWSISGDKPGGGWSTSSLDKTALERRYGPGRMLRIS